MTIALPPSPLTVEELTPQDGKHEEEDGQHGDRVGDGGQGDVERGCDVPQAGQVLGGPQDADRTHRAQRPVAAGLAPEEEAGHRAPANDTIEEQPWRPEVLAAVCGYHEEGLQAEEDCENGVADVYRLCREWEREAQIRGWPQAVQSSNVPGSRAVRQQAWAAAHRCPRVAHAIMLHAQQDAGEDDEEEDATLEQRMLRQGSRGEAQTNQCAWSQQALQVEPSL